MSRIAARALLGLTVVLVPVGVALAVVGVHRDPQLGDGWESRLLLTGIGGAAALLFALVGSFIVRAEARNAIGWIFLGSGVLLAAVVAEFGYVDVAQTRADSLPAADWVEWVGSWSFLLPVFIAPAIVAQIFPDGRPLPGRWRWLLWITVATAVESVIASALDPTALDAHRLPFGLPEGIGDAAERLNDAGGVVLAPAIFTASLAALVVRFRRSRGVERQQMKWLAFAGAVPVSAFTLSFLISPFFDDGLLVDVVFIVGFTGLMLIPVAVAVAILRYRLYEIDRVISRTLVYGGADRDPRRRLRRARAGGAGGVLVVRGRLESGDRRVSTLVVAALFLPLRSRVQRVVDRRFYRRRYDAQRTLEAFGARLREQVELDGLRTDLEGVVARDDAAGARLALAPRGRGGEAYLDLVARVGHCGS